MNTRELVCTVCPISCRLTIQDENGNLFVIGNRCPRGERYAKSEYTHPMRVVTTTVKLLGADIRRLPVISGGEVPKERLQDCLKQLYAITVQAPVQCGDVIVSNICGSGVDIIAARTIEGSEME